MEELLSGNNSARIYLTQYHPQNFDSKKLAEKNDYQNEYICSDNAKAYFKKGAIYTKESYVTIKEL